MFDVFLIGVIHRVSGRMEAWSLLRSFISLLINMVIMRLISFGITLFQLQFFAKKTLATQGISGPRVSSWVTGNAAELRKLFLDSTSQDMPSVSHNLLPRLHPLEHKYSPIYGRNFLTWSVGWEPTVNIAEPELIQEVLASGDFHKSGIQNRFMQPLFGAGLPMALGKAWEAQKKMITPVFHSEKMKDLQEIALKECANELVKSWSQLVKKDYNELNVHAEFISASAKVISKAMFGSSSLQRMDEYINLEHRLVDLVFKQSVLRLIPGYSYIPTRGNRNIWRVSRELRSYMKELIQARLSEAGDDQTLLGNDILGLFLRQTTTRKRNSLKLNISMELLVDECKSMFFAGHETTANLLTWCTMLLAINPQWQLKARDEVRQTLSEADEFPTPQLVSKMKTVGAIVSETLRLYPPVLKLRRKASKDIKLGNKLLIPNNVSVELSILSVHHDKNIWGGDALEFNPARFLEKKAGVPSPGSYLPFGSGPRLCIGRPFALVEAKTILCMLLQRFQWKMSPNYRHSPQAGVTVYPKHGMQLIVSFCDK